MHHVPKQLMSIIAAIILCLLASCAGRKPQLDQNTAVGFEEGIRRLASNLSYQLEQSSIENKLQGLASGKLAMKKLAIDPFIDVESGYPAKVNDQIVRIMSQVMKNKFDIGGEMEPDTLQSSVYVISGMVTIDDKKLDIRKVFATIFDKSSGAVLASSTVRVKNLDTTPKQIYKDSPVFLKGDSYKQQVESVKKNPQEKVSREYQSNLTAKSLQVKGDNLYEQQDYDKSLVYYNQAAKLGQGEQLNVLNGLFTNTMAQGNYDSAESVYGRLIRASLKETGEIASTISFAPAQRSPLADKERLHQIYMRGIASLVVSQPDCKLQIVGHSSRTGAAAFNEKLSKDRADWIQEKMASYYPAISKRSTTIGRGFSENIVGTGKDDYSDQVDRRVEFILYNCAQ